MWSGHHGCSGPMRTAIDAYRRPGRSGHEVSYPRMSERATGCNGSPSDRTEIHEERKKPDKVGPTSETQGESRSPLTGRSHRTTRRSFQRQAGSPAHTLDRVEGRSSATVLVWRNSVKSDYCESGVPDGGAAGIVGSGTAAALFVPPPVALAAPACPRRPRCELRTAAGSLAATCRSGGCAMY